MGLNDASLPDILLEQLYRRHLVQDAAAVRVQGGAEAPIANAALKQAGTSAATDVPLQFLGKNLQHVVMLVNYAQEVHLPDVQLEFLGNILKACQLNLGDVAIVNCYKQTVNEQQLQQLRPRLLLLFDIEPAAIGLLDGVPDFTITTVKDMAIIQAPALEKLNQPGEEGKLLKGKLWLCLKQLLKL